MIFRQLFEPTSATYTYLLACSASGDALLIDPVLETVERDRTVLDELGLTLRVTLETHVHADHLTGANKLNALTGCQIAGPAMDGIACRDVGIEEGVALQVGEIDIQPLHTPGHTSTHFAYLVAQGPQPMVFTGDALLIDGCGRTDFQAGDAVTLYRSIHEKLFTLPDDTLVYPGHDYTGRRVSTIGQEKNRNPRLGGGMSEAEFVAIMAGLNLPDPVKMQFAVPGNERCGICPPDVPEHLKGPCEVDKQG